MRYILTIMMLLMAGNVWGAYNCADDANVFGCWLMNDTSGGAVDGSSNGRDLTEEGTPTYSVTGQFGDAIDLDGSTENFHGDSYESALDDLAEGTIAVWIQTDDTAKFQGLVCITDASTNNDLVCLSLDFVSTTANAHYQCKIGADTGSSFTVEALNAADTWSSANEWHSIVITVETGVGNKIYIDGVAATSPTYSSSDDSTNVCFFADVSAANTDSFDVGKRAIQAATNRVDGAMDNILITGTVLTASEVLDYHNNGITTVSAGSNKVFYGGTWFNGSF